MPDWDSEGAPAIPAEEWRRAETLTMCILGGCVGAEDAVAVSPCGDGSIHLRFTRTSRSVLVEIRGSELALSVRIAEDRTSILGAFDGFGELLARVHQALDDAGFFRDTTELIRRG